MFLRRKAFTQAEMEKLVQAKNAFIDGIRSRSIAPDDFSCNLAYLRKQQEGLRLLMQVVTPHLEKEANARDKAAQINIDVAMLGKDFSEYNVVNEATKITMTQGYNQLVKAEFAREPRIIDVLYNETNEEKILDGSFEPVAQCTINAKIKFSDGTKLKLNSLEDEKELLKAKEFFDDKMQEIAAVNDLSSRVSVRYRI